MVLPWPRSRQAHGEGAGWWTWQWRGGRGGWEEAQGTRRAGCPPPTHASPGHPLPCSPALLPQVLGGERPPAPRPRPDLGGASLQACRPQVSPLAPHVPPQHGAADTHTCQPTQPPGDLCRFPRGHSKPEGTITRTGFLFVSIFSGNSPFARVLSGIRLT